MKSVLSTALASWLLATAAYAHHSNAEYDRSALRELEGELVGVAWANPHVAFKLRTVNDAGAVEDWELGGLPINLLEKAGLSLLNNGSLLRYTQTVTDPASLAEPMTVTWDLFDADDLAIEPVQCQ